jgi:NADPH-dependent F420 reductase
MTDTRLTLAVLGGTGAEGSGLAFRWAHKGHKVIIGSRAAEKAQQAASELNASLGRDIVRGSDNLSATKEADVAILTVPYAAQRSTIESVRPALAGKILIDVTVPLVPPKVSRVQLPADGSAVESLQKHLGPEVKVVSAFQNVSAHHLKDLDHQVECDVLVCSDDKDAAQVAINLAKDAGLRGIYAGPLANSVVAEGLTSVLIGINQRFKIPGAGIRITGLPD